MTKNAETIKFEFNDKLENYDRVAHECLNVGERIQEAVASGRVKRADIPKFIGEMVYNFRERVIEEERDRFKREKRSFSQGLNAAVEKAIDQYIYSTLKG